VLFPSVDNYCKLLTKFGQLMLDSMSVNRGGRG